MSGLRTVPSPSDASAFAGSGVSTLRLPATLQTIGSSAFASCAGLTSVSLPGELTAVGANAFASCTNLASVSLPGKVTAVGASAFANCTSLKKVLIPKSVTTIGSNAFANTTATLYVYAGSDAAAHSAANYPAQTVVMSLTLNQHEAMVPVGGTAQLSAAVRHFDPDVTWVSSNQAVATVDQNGLVSGLSAGTATITAKVSGDTSILDSCTVTVPQASGVTISPFVSVIRPNRTAKLTAAVSPASASQHVTWSTDNASIATVDDLGAVTGRGVGYAWITATSDNSLTGRAMVRVTEDLVDVTISLDNTPALNGGYELKVGDVLPIIANAKPEGVGCTFVLKSSNAKIATVDEGGVVEGVKPGTATIAVTAKGTLTGATVSRSFQVTVIAPATGVSLAATADVLLGAKKKLAASPTPSNATIKDITWTSGDPAVASVSSDGTVTALSLGTTHITRDGARRRERHLSGARDIPGVDDHRDGTRAAWAWCRTRARCS